MPQAGDDGTGQVTTASRTDGGAPFSPRRTWRRRRLRTGRVCRDLADLPRAAANVTSAGRIVATVGTDDGRSDRAGRIPMRQIVPRRTGAQDHAGILLNRRHIRSIITGLRTASFHERRTPAVAAATRVPSLEPHGEISVRATGGPRASGRGPSVDALNQRSVNLRTQQPWQHIDSSP
jgi:hypothetical protein